MAKDILDLVFPLGGQHKGVGYQQESPYFFDSGKNFWPRDPLAGRMRGGSRPGLQRQFTETVTGPIHLLANVRLVETLNLIGFEERFDTSLGSQWTYPAWLPTEPVYVNADGTANIQPTSSTTAVSGGRVLSSLSADLAGTFTAQLDILHGVEVGSPLVSPFQQSAVYSLFLRMNNATPNLLNYGVLVEADYSLGIQSGTLRISEYIAGTKTVLGTFLTALTGFPPVTLKAVITADSVVVTLGGNPNNTLTRSVTAAVPVGSQRVGFGITGKASTGSIGEKRVRIDNFRVTYTDSSVVVPNRNAVVAAGGTNAGASSTLDVKYEDTINVLTRPATVAGGTTNPKARHLQAAELLGRLYIVGEDDEQIWCLTPLGTGHIGTIAEAHVVSAFSPVPAGTPESNCTWIAAWRTRLVVGGQRTDPQNVFMSKAGEPQNWSYLSLPVGSALALNTTGIDTGRLGEPCNAGIAHSDDYLILGCLNSLYVLRGDPTYGGQIDRLSSSIGIVSPQAWARGPDGETLFLSSDGLYGIAAGVMGYPTSVSREVLPQELRDIDVNNNRILMAYDVRNRGVFIGLTPILGSGGKYFWFDWQTRGFWPMEFNGSFEPTSLVYRNADSPIDQRLLFGCRDGTIRAMNDAAATDDGVLFPTELLIGPISLGGGGYYDGIFVEYVGQLGEGSGDLTAEFQVGNSIEAARNATPRYPTPLKAGKNKTARPRLRGNATFIKLSSPGGAAVAVENQTMVRQRLGKQRLP